MQANIYLKATKKNPWWSVAYENHYRDNFEIVKTVSMRTVALKRF